jgi:hypothetical protein
MYVGRYVCIYTVVPSEDPLKCPDVADIEEEPPSGTTHQ